MSPFTIVSRFDWLTRAGWQRVYLVIGYIHVLMLGMLWLS